MKFVETFNISNLMFVIRASGVHIGKWIEYDERIENDYSPMKKPKVTIIIFFIDFADALV